MRGLRRLGQEYANCESVRRAGAVDGRPSMRREGIEEGEVGSLGTDGSRSPREEGTADEAGSPSMGSGALDRQCAHNLVLSSRILSG